MSDTFSAKTTVFDLRNALHLALMSEFAYKDEGLLRNGGIVVCASRDIQALVMANDDAIIVAFRGTRPSQLSDWMSDFDIAQQLFSSHLACPEVGSVHRGFYGGMLLVFDKIVSAIEKLQTGSQTLWITGHSLGGALAVMFAAAVAFAKRMPINGVYTFGQPRVGDTAFCTQCDSHFGDVHFRFVNNEDIVTRVAPRIVAALPPLFYGHSGQVKYFDAAGALQHDEHWWNEFLIRIPVSLASLGLPVEDHSIDRYIANIQKALAV